MSARMEIYNSVFYSLTESIGMTCLPLSYI